LLLAGIGLLAFASFACRLAPPTPIDDRTTVRVIRTEELTPDRDADLATRVAALGGTVAAVDTTVAAQATQIQAGVAAEARQALQLDVLRTVNAQQAAEIEELNALQEPVARNGTIVAYLATRVGALARDAGTTASPPTMTPYLPVLGSVELEGGRCCAGGIAGETITVTAAFTATSPLAPVTEMRMHAGSIAADWATIANVPWASFVEEKGLSVPVALNWTSFHVTVQYRDAEGHVSPLYHDDISIEGEPAPRTPTPNP
jgi:hypothetical protein